MPKRRIMEDFQITEISGVDRPAQAHAKMTIMKRQDPLVTEIVKRQITEGAKTFGQLIDEREEQQRRWKAQEELWPLFDTLRDSVNSITADGKLDAASKEEKLTQSTTEFVAAVREKFPDVEAELTKLLTADANVGDHIAKKENQMADELKKVADLETQVADLTKKLEASTANTAELTLKASMSDIEKNYYEGLDDAAKKSFTALSAEDRLKKAKLAKAEKEAGDEMLKTADGVEIRKSVVGEASFAILKSQEARIAKQDEDLKKANEATAMVEFTKRAETEVAHLPGEAIAKAQVFKAVSVLPEDVRKTLDAMLKAGDAAIKMAFDKVGGRGGEVVPNSPEDQVNKKAEELRKADATLTQAQAIAKVYNDHPELYDQTQQAN